MSAEYAQKESEFMSAMDLYTRQGKTFITLKIDGHVKSRFHRKHNYGHMPE
jgi:hypothetical protein